eukprot:scaffold278463_cov28-Tisochrysis_lutea.AAC.1
MPAGRRRPADGVSPAKDRREVRRWANSGWKLRGKVQFSASRSGWRKGRECRPKKGKRRLCNEGGNGGENEGMAIVCSCVCERRVEERAHVVECGGGQECVAERQRRSARSAEKERTKRRHSDGEKEASLACPWARVCVWVKDGEKGAMGARERERDREGGLHRSLRRRGGRRRRRVRGAALLARPAAARACSSSGAVG